MNYITFFVVPVCAMVQRCFFFCGMVKIRFLENPDDHLPNLGFFILLSTMAYLNINIATTHYILGWKKHPEKNNSWNHDAEITLNRIDNSYSWPMWAAPNRSAIVNSFIPRPLHPSFRLRRPDWLAIETNLEGASLRSARSLALLKWSLSGGSAKRKKFVVAIGTQCLQGPNICEDARFHGWSAN